MEMTGVCLKPSKTLSQLDSLFILKSQLDSLSILKLSYSSSINRPTVQQTYTE